MDFDDVDSEQPPPNFFRRYRVAIIVVAVLLTIVGVIAKIASSGGTSSRRDPITMVNLPPPPPPPPPLQSTPPPPQEEQRMEQPMIKEDQPKSEPPKEEPPLGTGIKGEGPDSYGLGDKAGNGRIGGDRGNGSKWGWYASQVQSRIQEAMQRNRKTRSASLTVNVRVWPDGAGRIARAQLAGSTGDPALDGAIRDEVLTGLQLQEPPPPGMPSPITLRLMARRPH